MSDFDLGHRTFQDPAALPEHLRRLHRKVTAAKRAGADRKPRRKDVDETGRNWRGLVKDKPPQPTE